MGSAALAILLNINLCLMLHVLWYMEQNYKTRASKKIMKNKQYGNAWEHKYYQG